MKIFTKRNFGIGVSIIGLGIGAKMIHDGIKTNNDIISDIIDTVSDTVSTTVSELAQTTTEVVVDEIV